MNNTIRITVNTDAETKKAAEELFAELGLNMTTAVNIFLKRALLERGIPFGITTNVPNTVNPVPSIKCEKNTKDDAALDDLKPVKSDDKAQLRH